MSTFRGEVHITVVTADALLPIEWRATSPTPPGRILNPKRAGRILNPQAVIRILNPDKQNRAL